MMGIRTTTPITGPRIIANFDPLSPLSLDAAAGAVDNGVLVTVVVVSDGTVAELNVELVVVIGGLASTVIAVAVGLVT